jgi:4-hydroxy-3-methylbut-2-en-1-yl diphosphate reductase
MQIDIDDHSGFCYGVVKTIQLAEEALNEGLPVYCLGEIVHNEEEVERLKSKGLIIIDHEDLKDLSGVQVLIRAHGEPPETYGKITDQSNLLKEGTCPIVLHLQKKVKTAFEEMKMKNGQVVIYGKKNHAEVVGLAGQTGNMAIIISHLEDLDQLDFERPITLLSQTTQSMEGFEIIISAIKKKMLKHFPANEVPLTVTDSICKHVSKRGEYLTTFAKAYDVIIFVCGTNSSNGKILYEICRKNNPKAYWISHAGMVRPEWFLNVRTVGISGATSTPHWLMEEVGEKIKSIVSNKEIE